MKIPRVKVKTEYVKFYGGLDTESPVLSISPGAFIQGDNYVCGKNGGYERIDGYERYSGQPAPSDAVYHYCPCTFADGGPAVGDTITGVTSGSTGIVITVGAAYINIVKRSAAFTIPEEFAVGGTTKGTITSTETASGETTAALHATALNAAADIYRADINKPAGAYPIRGLALLKGVLYAFVDNTTGTTGEIYKATATGWVNVPLLNQISFSSGAAAIADGDTVTQLVSGASAVVSRVVLESGTWAAGTAAGRLIIGTITGAFNATNILQVDGVSKATASSLATAIVISPGGRYETIVTNFTGSTDTARIYGCDGVNYGFEFDGTVYVPIHTGMTTDKPQYVKAFKQHLFFSFRGSSQNSAPGEPYVWSAVSGAMELAVGEDITGYTVEAETLLVHSRHSTNQLIGENIDTFTVDPLNADIGAIPRTCQNIGLAYCLDDRGIIQVIRAQEFGNFNIGTVSQAIQTEIDRFRPLVVASSVHKSKNQYRLYGSDGTGICMTVGMGEKGLEHYFAPFRYPKIVSCTVSGEDSTGKDVVFFGSTDGMVCQVEKGSSFDGDEIEAILWLPFNNSKSPTLLKSYRKATLIVSANGYAALSAKAEFNYGDDDAQSHITENIAVEGAGGFWDVSNWDEFYYDSKYKTNSSIPLAGDGGNMSISIYSKSDTDMGHKMDGLIIHFTPRRFIR